MSILTHLRNLFIGDVQMRREMEMIDERRTAQLQQALANRQQNTSSASSSSSSTIAAAAASKQVH